MGSDDFEHSPHGDRDSGVDRLSARDTWILLIVIAALVLVLCFTSPRLSNAAVVHLSHGGHAASQNIWPGWPGR